MRRFYWRLHSTITIYEWEQRRQQQQGCGQIQAFNYVSMNNEKMKKKKEVNRRTHTHKMLFVCVYLSHEYWINYVVLWHKARVNTDRYCSNIYWQFGQCFHYWTVTTETDGDAQLTLLVIVLRFAWFTGDKNAKTVRHCNIYDQIQIHSPFWKRVPGSLNPFVC